MKLANLPAGYKFNLAVVDDEVLVELYFRDEHRNWYKLGSTWSVARIKWVGYNPATIEKRISDVSKKISENLEIYLYLQRNVVR